MATTVLALWQAKDKIVETATVLVKTFFSPEHVKHLGAVKFECKLAPSFVDTQYLDKVSDDTKVMVAVANKGLQKTFPEATKFGDIQGEFNANLQTVMSQKGDPKEIHKIFTTEDKSFFNFDASDGPSQKSVELIRNWISNELITDPVVLATSGLNKQDTVRGLITISGNNFQLISNKEQAEELVVDLGILIYPSQSDQTIRLINIKLYVWIKDFRLGSVTKYEVGLRGSVFSQIYEPNAEGIKKGLTPHTIESAIKEYETFVSEVHEFVKD